MTASAIAPPSKLITLFKMQDFSPEVQDSQPRRPQRQHSRLGMVALGLAIAAAVSFMGCFLTMGIALLNNPDLAGPGFETGDLTVAMVVTLLLVLLSIFCALFGFVIGILSIFITRRHKLFPILGTALNTTMLVLIFGLGLLGVFLQD